MTKNVVTFAVPSFPSIFQVDDMSLVLVSSIGIIPGNFLDHQFPSSSVASSYHLYRGFMCSWYIASFSCPITNFNDQQIFLVCGKILSPVMGHLAEKSLTFKPVTQCCTLLMAFAPSDARERDGFLSPSCIHE